MATSQSSSTAKAHSQWRSTCCNPFSIRGHTARKSALRPVANWMCEKHPLVQMGSKICDTCRKKLAKFSEVPTSGLESDLSPCTPSDSSSDSETIEEEQYDPLHLVNLCLEDLDETPVTKRKLRTKKYSKRKLENVTAKMEVAMLGKRQSSPNDESEILQQLKEKFHSTVENSVKVQILTILPKSWSISKIQAEFGASNFMARKAKQLVKEKGVLSSPDPRPGHSIPRETSDLVIAFYEDDSFSRLMPGKKDFVSVKFEHGRTQVQKRLILCNLRELYQLFKEKYPHEKIGFSKFAELRPKHCVLAGASGTHSVCALYTRM